MSVQAAVVLAAGKGTRMNSELPKVFHRVCGREMAGLVFDAVRGAGVDRVVVVVGPDSTQAEMVFGKGVGLVRQPKQLGTGHALLCTEEILKDLDSIVVLSGDVPLIRSETVRGMMDLHTDRDACITILTSKTSYHQGLGRVVRDESNNVKGIVEESDDSGRGDVITEVNAGIYCFKVSWLWENLKKLAPSGNGEIYVTALVSAAFVQGKLIESFEAPKEETLGINTRVQLADAEKKLRNKILEYWMTTGVTITDPSSVYIDVGVEIGLDTVLHPNTHLKGVSKIGKGCEIGPNTIIEASTMGDRCKVTGSVVEGTVMKSNIVVGPYSHLRCGTFIDDNVHIGNFAEVNRSSVGKETRFSHFGYIGDAEISAKVNIGAGTVTCNYDGKRKNQTRIGEGVFIGSDTMLVAPVEMGARSKSGAGSVLTKDVPPDSLVFGVPAKSRPAKKNSDR